MSLGRIPSTKGLAGDAWRYAARRTVHGFVRHRGLDAAAALTFFAALALFPGALVVVSGFAIASGGSAAGVDRILDVLSDVLPPTSVEAARSPIESFLTIPNPGVALGIGLLGGIWTVSSYATAFGRAMNSVYEVEEGRPFWWFRARMMLVAVLLVIGGTVIVVILLGTPSVARAIGGAAGIPQPWIWLWLIGKWPVLVALAFTLVGVLYYATPNVKHLRLRWVSWGALFAIVVWGLATVGFGVYVVTVDSYNRVYGWVGGAVIALLWLYITNYVLVLGAEADAEIVRIRQLTAGIPAETAIQLPLRDTRRNLMIARQRAWDEREGRALREHATHPDPAPPSDPV
ncbi:YihY/virulence factor BrkB family protein [Galbitalea sp. SE-J8]|uniref:YihY/virulence factor BrkB family protein n=1 Tax=Galbitalea sp. SE-J8 TaxID=3054952 RepID=UPI00259CCC51|nr:YihY/virulence factor BrkB family protein [Galbitalea sp. SE-J8]MDM4762609.1 YihY/virulence factor BrkB family protein [Galbitalea sp. SE-J8]